MSVCFFVPADQAGTSAVSEEGDTEVAGEEGSSPENIQQSLQAFWAKVTDDIKKVNADDFKTQALPLARIKKIMKLDEEVKMISAEAPVLFAKAAEIFIHELTLRAWSHTEDNKRRTLQRNDIAMAISKSDQLDFLIDIVPRQEVKPTKTREEPPRASNTEQYYLQLAQQHQAALQGAQPQYLLQPCAQVVQQSGNASTSSGGQPLTLVQQVVTSSGELQQVPIQLSQAQLNLVRPQLQNNAGQLIVIQAQPQQTPQIIQVSSHGGQNQPQQVFLAQVATTQEET
ncbi:PREDICTED: nuclear transcription factor Y subunit gamma-like isoform X1 [Papilio polytes]|uniref:nuclear transcription factor Y subunit gamma-like isoform X1 n=1 Tax=Papilio polytes TaxID=76194 RepID=UPI00067666E8|nr:PREDICTED: nuclear transcription factor Y subunit gamma-like isoform X1 [Papilio polytes]